MPGRWHLHVQPHIKNPGQEYLMGLSGTQHFTLLSHTVTVGIQCLLCVTLLGKDPQQLAPGFLWTLHHVPLADLALHPFAIIRHSLSKTIC